MPVVQLRHGQCDRARPCAGRHGNLARGRARHRLRQDAQHTGRPVMKTRPNYLAGLGAFIWLIIVAVPLYVMLQATFETQVGYGKSGALGLPSTFTLNNYVNAFTVGFGHYFVNTLIVTLSVVLIVVALVLPLSYAVVRNQSRRTTFVFRFFLLGLAIPAQVVIVPIFYLISLAGLYDTLIGIILPTAAFALPICTLILRSEEHTS